MKSSSCKNKGRRLQQQVRDSLIEKLGIDPLDIESTAMGQSGCDLYLSKAARGAFPYGVECKNVEALNVWASMKQCETNASKEKLTPLLVIHRNNSKTYALVELDELLRLVKGASS